MNGAKSLKGTNYKNWLRKKWNTGTLYQLKIKLVTELFHKKILDPRWPHWYILSSIEKNNTNPTYMFSETKGGQNISQLLLRLALLWYPNQIIRTKVQSGGAERARTHLLHTGTASTPTYRQFLWKRTEGWVNSLCTFTHKKWQERWRHGNSINATPEVVTYSREGCHWATRIHTHHPEAQKNRQT